MACSPFSIFYARISTMNYYTAGNNLSPCCVDKNWMGCIEYTYSFSCCVCTLQYFHKPHNDTQGFCVRKAQRTHILTYPFPSAQFTTMCSNSVLTSISAFVIGARAFNFPMHAKASAATCYSYCPSFLMIAKHRQPCLRCLVMNAWFARRD